MRFTDSHVGKHHFFSNRMITAFTVKDAAIKVLKTI